MTYKPNSPAAERNAGPILEVLRFELRHARTVLEIGSGTGQHAVVFGQELPYLTWQTSDLKENHTGIAAWLADARLSNVHAPLCIDVMNAQLPAGSYDAVFSANTAHIMSMDAVEKMFGLVSAVLNVGGLFCLYGPFREDGSFNTESNAKFDESLRAQDPDMGIRNLETLDEFAATGGLRRTRRYSMPANNMLVVWTKHEGDDSHDHA